MPENRACRVAGRVRHYLDSVYLAVKKSIKQNQIEQARLRLSGTTTTGKFPQNSMETSGVHK